MSVEALVEWAVAGGAYLEPIEIGVAPDGNRSVFARRDVAEGELLLALPRALMIGDSDIAATPLGRAMAGVAPMLYSRYMPIAAWVAMERRAAASPWAPYLDALPSSGGAWPPDVASALSGTRAGALLDERARQLEEDRRLLVDLLGGELASISAEALAWGLFIARSRCFEVAATHGIALVPIADMLDHCSNPEATWSYDAEAGRFEMKAARSLEAGDAIRHSYGSHDNARWLAGYGFVLESNPDDEVTLHMTPDGEAVQVGTRFDKRFVRAMDVARRARGIDDEPAMLRAIGEAARRAAQRIADGERDLAVDEPWARICQIVRSGERAVLAAIVTFAERAAELAARPADEQRAIARGIAVDADGADRLLLGFLLARG